MKTLSPPLPPRSAMGFTLIELMITVAIVAILATIAYPSYQEHIRRGHRSAAQGQMMDIANREQQFLLANRRYGDKDEIEGTGFALPAEIAARYDYDITVGTGAAPTFQITFTARGAQLADGDLDLHSDGRKEPAGKW